MAKTRISGIHHPPIELRLLSAAFQISWCSRDPFDQIGVVVTDSKHSILSSTYNDKIDTILDKDISYDEADIFMPSPFWRAIKLATLACKEHYLIKIYSTHMPSFYDFKFAVDSGIRGFIVGPLKCANYPEADLENIKRLSKLVPSVTLEKYDFNPNWSRDKWEVLNENILLNHI